MRHPLPGQELLQRFIADGDDRSFEQIVRAYIDLVFSIARRECGNPSLAEDVTQQVFVLLARKATTILKSESLPVWLHRVAINKARDLMRAESRRQRRETTAFSLHMNPPGYPANWDAIAPELDQVVARLPEKDREAILLKFYAGKSYSDIARMLGSTGEAIRKRCDRALEQMRVEFGKRGIATTASILGTVLPSHAVSPAPALTVVKTLAAVSALPKLSPLGLFLITMKSSTKVIIAAAALSAAIGIPIYLTHQNSTQEVTSSSRPETPNRSTQRPAPNAEANGPESPVARKRRIQLSDAERALWEARLNEIMAMEEGPEQARQFEGFIQSLGGDSEKFRQVATLLQEMSETQRLRVDFDAMIAAWTLTDRESSLDWLERNRKEDIGKYLPQWYAENPEAAYQWARDHGDVEKSGNPYLKDIVGSLSYSPENLAFGNKVFNSMPPSLERPFVGRQVADLAMQQSPQAARDWVSSQSGDDRDFAFSYIVFDLLKKDTAPTLDWIYQNYSKKNPAAFMDEIPPSNWSDVESFINRLPPGDAKDNWKAAYAAKQQQSAEGH